MPAVENQYDGNAARVSLYARSVTAGDTSLQTTLPNADAVALGTATCLDVQSTTYVYNGATWDRLRTPNKFNHVIATAAGNTAVWTPAAGKKFRLMRFAVGISGGTTLAVAGIETVTFQDSATGLNGVRFDVQIPTTAINGEEYFSGWIDWGNGFLSAVANNVLNVNLGTATTAGGVTVMVAGTED